MVIIAEVALGTLIKNIMIKKFSKDYLTDELNLPWWDENVVEDEIVDHGRWDIHHRLVFQDLDGTYWETTYWEGATEMQPERPWEYDSEIECEQVEPKKVVVTKFLPVDDRKNEIKKELTYEEKQAFKNFLNTISKEDAEEFFDLLDYRIGDDLK